MQMTSKRKYDDAEADIITSASAPPPLSEKEVPSSACMQSCMKVTTKKVAVGRECCHPVEPGAVEKLPPIRVISFESFRQLGEFPRYPNHRHLTVHADTVSVEDTFFVFISHCWLGGYDGSLDWRGMAHPDTLDNDKFQICIRAIEKAWKGLAPGRLTITSLDLLLRPIIYVVACNTDLLFL
jgi:hypothetical protein